MILRDIISELKIHLKAQSPSGYYYIFTYIHINHLEIKTLWKAFVPCCWDHELSIEIPKVTEVRSNQARKSAIKLSNRDYLPKHSGYTKYYEKKKRTRLTNNCAHLRSTKESLTIWVKIFWLKFFWVNIFLS